MKICERSLCTGCSVCADVCPKQCVEIKYDSDGFLQSYVDEDKCVKCNKCISVCPANNPNNKNCVSKAYKIRRNDSGSAMNSTSGGIASLISEMIIGNNGVVVGCGFDENLVLKHSITNNKTELEKFKGSKYVQSNTKGIYSEIGILLNNGNNVLFIGTPCQVAALNNYLVKPYKNLYTIDLVCHGVSSQKVLDKYTSGIMTDGKLINIRFRNKDNGYKNGMANSMQYVFDNTIKSVSYKEGVGLWFASGLTLRESCYKCRFAEIKRCADISLADYGANDLSETEKKYGVSLMFINTAKGEMLFKMIEQKSTSEEKQIENSIQMCARLHHKSDMPYARKKFFKDLDKLSFEELSKKYILKRILPGRIVLYMRAIKKHITGLKE